jgi:hypothetical protein
MSLVSSASPWTNNDNVEKKRVPSMRRTLKKPPSQNEATEYASEEKAYLESQIPESIETTQNNLEERNNRVSQLINQLTSDNDGNKLADFSPIENPAIQKRSDSENASTKAFADNDILGPVQPNPARIYQQTSQSTNPLNYAPNHQNLGGFYSNYRTSYETPRTPMQNAATSSVSVPINSLDSRLMEKINYMIHMLEEQHNEKTSNITEEFLLYMFLGVFIIFIVDSFARAGKYIR